MAILNTETTALDADSAAMLERLEEMRGGEFARIDIGTARTAMRAILAEFGGAQDRDCERRAVDIPGEAGVIPARLYKRRGKHDPSFLIVFFHGGGWALGDLDTYDDLISDLAAQTDGAFLSVDYRLAPENKFPAGLYDCVAAVQWAARKADDFRISSNRLAVAGDSAGGNLAAAVSSRLRQDTQGPALAAQFLLYPLLDVASPHEAYPSRIRFGSGPYFLTCSDIDRTRSWYLDEMTRPEDPAVSPIFAERLDQLPPTVIVTAGFDPLKDEGEAYAWRLRQAGVAVTSKNFGSTIHGFLSFGVLGVARSGRDWLAREISRWLG